MRITRSWSPEWAFSRSAGSWNCINKLVKITQDVEKYGTFYQASQGRAVKLQLSQTMPPPPEAAAAGAGEDPTSFPKWFADRPFGGRTSRNIFSTEMSYRRQHFTQAFPSFMSLNVFYPHPAFPGWGLRRCFSLLWICCFIVQLAPQFTCQTCSQSCFHFSMSGKMRLQLTSFALRLVLLAVLVVFVFLVWSWLPQQPHSS